MKNINSKIGRKYKKTLASGTRIQDAQAGLRDPGLALLNRMTNAESSVKCYSNFWLYFGKEAQHLRAFHPKLPKIALILIQHSHCCWMQTFLNILFPKVSIGAWKSNIRHFRKSCQTDGPT